MRTERDVEAYLLHQGRPFEKSEDVPPGSGTTFLLRPRRGHPPVAIRVDAPIVLVRTEMGPVPSETAQQAAFFRQLLEWNASSLVHASYGIDNNRIILSSALELENLDLNELVAALDEVELVLTQHAPAFAKAAQTT